MEWAVMQEGRVGVDAILLIVGERKEAETIAAEVCSRGHRVNVRPYVGGGPVRPSEARMAIATPAISRPIF